MKLAMRLAVVPLLGLLACEEPCDDVCATGLYISLRGAGFGADPLPDGGYEVNLVADSTTAFQGFCTISGSSTTIDCSGDLGEIVDREGGPGGPIHTVSFLLTKDRFAGGEYPAQISYAIFLDEDLIWNGDWDVDVAPPANACTKEGCEGDSLDLVFGE